ncbi:MAG TPA: VWA domain-containing protein [Acidobacteriota bacterium]|nr:VWA domain-containing protein [Acidobacteriota bacterium]
MELPEMYKPTANHKQNARILLWFAAALICGNASGQTYNYEVEVQVVDLQVSVTDEHGQFVSDLKPEDFMVTENGAPQDVLDLEINRQPFSIGVLLDTSSSMQPIFQIVTRGTRDFLSSLRQDDEYFLMTFDEKIRLLKDLGTAGSGADAELKKLRFGECTRLFDALMAALERLKQAQQPRRALFLISDGVNTAGGGSLGEVIEAAQRAKTIVYAMVAENGDSDILLLRTLTESTGGTYFVLYDNFPRLQAAYDKIAADLAHRFTLYYRSESDPSRKKPPVIHVQMKNPRWHVQYQKAYYR